MMIKQQAEPEGGYRVADHRHDAYDLINPGSMEYGGQYTQAITPLR